MSGEGDFYYLIEFCDKRDEIRIFRMDRIKNSPNILEEPLVPKPEDYDLKHYTQEAFRMYATDEVVTVELLCYNIVMRRAWPISTKKCSTMHWN